MCGGKYVFVAFLTFISMIFCTNIASASPLVHRNINPSFGGAPFNSPHLIGLATTQRAFDAPVRGAATGQDFADRIRSSILSRVSFNIAEAILGEDAQDSGRFVVGDTTLEFERVDGQILITIDEQDSGQSTVIEIPVADF